MPAARRALLVHPLSWRSRHLRAVVGVVVLISMVRLVWGWHTHRVLQAQLDEIRRRAEPATLAELKFEPLPDAQNAWASQVKAATIADGSGVLSPSASNDEYREFPPFPDYWMKRAAASEAAHGKVFALARQARGLPRAQLRVGMTRPAVNSILLPALSHSRHLANTLKDGALYSHVRGDDVEAIERVRDVLHVARSLHSDPMIVSQLVGIGIDAMVSYTAQIMAPGLRLENEATRRAVRELIADLMDESVDWRGFEAGLRGERLMVDDFIDWSAGRSWLVRPIADMEAVRRNRYFAVVIEAGAARDWPRASAVLERAPREPARGNMLTAILTGRRPSPTVPRYSRFLVSEDWDLSRSFVTHFRAIADRRMAVVSLAAQLYRADHKRWPARLEELSPDYLPSVPADPYHDDGRPLGYVIKTMPPPAVGERPLVYAEEGPDVPTAVRGEPMYGYQNVRSASGRPISSARQYRDLARFEPPPSPEAVDGDPEKPDAPWAQPEKDGAAQ